jgi:negative regulator of sigma F NrsF-like protein
MLSGKGFGAVTCAQVNEEMMLRRGGTLPADAALHIAECQSCRRLAHLLSERTEAIPAPVQLYRIKSALVSDLSPVAPLPSPHILIARLTFVSILVLIAGSVVFGLRGCRALTLPLHFGLLVPSLAGAYALEAALVRQMVPGSGSALPLLTTALAAFASLTVIVSLTFSRPEGVQFVKGGVRCFVPGMMCTICAALFLWIVSRRGAFRSAPLLGATVGGLAGFIAMVGSQLRCPNPNGNHVLLWHSTLTAAGALGGLILGAVFALSVSLIETRRSSQN